MYSVRIYMVYTKVYRKIHDVRPPVHLHLIAGNYSSDSSQSLNYTKFLKQQTVDRLIFFVFSFITSSYTCTLDNKLHKM
jgi:hypothetical protein